MGCHKLTYYPTLDLVKNEYKKELTLNKSALNERSAYLYGFNGMEKDDEIKGGGNSYDFGARMYDPRLGRWLSVDKLTHKTPYHSSYSYAGNSPNNIVDSDGNIIIFINGLWGPAGGINDPGEEYWGWNGQWAQDLKDHWNDQNAMFFDGSVGGQGNLWNNSISSYRWLEGYSAGKANADNIIDNLSSGETIKFITNSMGAVYQRGFSDALMLRVSERKAELSKKRLEVFNEITALEDKISSEGPLGDLVMMDPQGNPVNMKDMWKVQLENKKKELENVNQEYEKISSIEIEIVVDIEPHQETSKDKNAKNHYYILSDQSEYNLFESGFLDIQPVKGATDASKKGDGTQVTGGHHNTFTKPKDLPQP